MNRWRSTRPLILITFLLLAGAVMNVAVAWGIAARARIEVWRAPSRQPPSWAVIPSYANSSPTLVRARVTPGYRYAEGTASLDLASDGQLRLRTTTLCVGWPASSLRAAWVEPTWQPPIPQDWRERLRPTKPPPAIVTQLIASPRRCTIEGLVPPNAMRRGGLFTVSSAEAVRIPTRPLLPGFAINTLFYAAMLAMPLSFFPMRRHLRARRGRCPKCGYDRAGLEQCPECGATC